MGNGRAGPANRAGGVQRSVPSAWRALGRTHRRSQQRYIAVLHNAWQLAFAGWPLLHLRAGNIRIGYRRQHCARATRQQRQSIPEVLHADRAHRNRYDACRRPAASASGIGYAKSSDRGIRDMESCTGSHSLRGPGRVESGYDRRCVHLSHS